jgi:hypothetical protein
MKVRNHRIRPVLIIAAGGVNDDNLPGPGILGRFESRFGIFEDYRSFRRRSQNLHRHSGTLKLSMDYPCEQQQDILDFLFPTITKGKSFTNNFASCLSPNCSTPTIRPSIRFPFKIDLYAESISSSSERVWESSTELDFQPNASAQGLAAKRSHNIEVIIPHTGSYSMSSAYWPALLTAIIENAASRDCSLRSFKIRCRVGAPTPGPSLITRETVPVETPANAAISLIVIVILTSFQSSGIKGMRRNAEVVFSADSRFD